ncbi:MAG: phosphoglucosamine mutase [Bacteroidales bacterium]|jgi:phosphomannomutase|nr:phosphoglucosamine mutase [Bacteroidales bacterium]
MTLIKSISGIRGTIGGKVGDSLTPVDIVKFSAAYCAELRKKFPKKKRLKVVVGRDARLSGSMVQQIVCGTLISCGIDVINAGLASTPTTEMAVILEKADGGIILTASHNPKQWNALKLLNNKGEFLTAAEGAAVVETADKERFNFAEIDSIGTLTNKDFTDAHINAVLKNSFVDVAAIKKAKFKVVLDAINSVGGVTMPKLLKKLGVKCIELNCNPTGNFAHNPEPLPKNLTQLSSTVIKEKADLGISVDPDVDRLAFMCEDGTPFGEEYTLVSCAAYVLEKKKGPTVSNMSSTRALRDVTEACGEKYYPAPVGEVNVTTMMHKVGAVIGGEGNGGVIFPALHCGRDAYMGVALFLSNLAHKKIKMTQLRATYPQYFISKNRIEISDAKIVDKVLAGIAKKYSKYDISTIDGVKINMDEKRSWAQLRKSNTEPIIRLYCEAPTKKQADAIAKEIIANVNAISH